MVLVVRPMEFESDRLAYQELIMIMQNETNFVWFHHEAPSLRKG